jgi:hypothetical protein
MQNSAVQRLEEHSVSASLERPYLYSPGHVIASLLKFHHSPTAVTSLPSSFLRSLQKRICFLIFWTVLIAMPFTIAQTTDFGLAPSTLSVLFAALRVDITWFDPLATSAGWTVYSILCCILLELLVPQLLEFGVEQTLHMLQGNMICGTALWRHVLWVLH